VSLMKHRNTPEPLRRRIHKGIIFAWFLVICSPDLRFGLSYFHWVVSLFPLSLLLPDVARRTAGLLTPLSIGSIVLVVSIIASGFSRAEMSAALLPAAKLLIILLYVAPAFQNRPDYWRLALLAFSTATLVNLALLVAGFLGFRGVSEMMAIGRWGTVLSYPGSLSRLPVAPFLLSAYGVGTGERLRLADLLLLTASVVVVLLDGSRTGALVVVLGGLYVLTVAASKGYREFRRGALRLAAFGAASVTALLGVFGAVGAEDTNAFERIAGVFEMVGAGGLAAAGEGEVRHWMIWKAWDQVQDSPLFGTGLNSVTVETVAGPMPVHNIYLQLWADVGLAGVAGYLLVVLGWIVLAPGVLKWVEREVPDSRVRAVYHTGVFLLIAWAFAGLFHPLSTELTEWLLFLTGYGILCDAVRGRILAKERVSVRCGSST
jgi:hypothetical protein